MTGRERDGEMKRTQRAEGRKKRTQKTTESERGGRGGGACECDCLNGCWLCWRGFLILACLVCPSGMGEYVKVRPGQGRGCCPAGAGAGAGCRCTAKQSKASKQGQVPGAYQVPSRYGFSPFVCSRVCCAASLLVRTTRASDEIGWMGGWMERWMLVRLWQS